ncbi:MAG: ribonuclease J [Pseudomonadota bacterium]|nr:ribonuclease J [Pseudomonadota bacterium]
MTQSAHKEVLDWVPFGGNNEDTIGGNGHLLVRQKLDAKGQRTGRGEGILLDLGEMFAPRGDKAADTYLPDVCRFLKHRDEPDHEPEIDLKGIFVSHGHQDHFGALAHLAKMGYKLPRIYGSKLTIEMIKAQFVMLDVPHAQWKNLFSVVSHKKPVKAGGFDVTAYNIPHSIPGQAFSIKAAGKHVFYSGDIRWDSTGLIHKGELLEDLKELDIDPIDLALVESTRANVEEDPVTEADVRNTIGDLLTEHPNRRMVATVMGSNLERIASLLKEAGRAGRKVVIHGASLENSLAAFEKAGLSWKEVLGDDVPEILMGNTEEGQRVQTEEWKNTMVLCTGTQGEPIAALMRAVFKKHKDFRLSKADVIVNSASIIPGNEAQIERMENALARQGMTYINSRDRLVHASGHGPRSYLRNLLQYIHPRFVVPIHGDKNQMKAARVYLEIIRGPRQRQSPTSVHNGDIIHLGAGGPRKIGRMPDLGWIAAKAKRAYRNNRHWIREYTYATAARTGVQPCVFPERRSQAARTCDI